MELMTGLGCAVPTGGRAPWAVRCPRAGGLPGLGCAHGREGSLGCAHGREGSLAGAVVSVGAGLSGILPLSSPSTPAMGFPRTGHLPGPREGPAQDARLRQWDQGCRDAGGPAPTACQSAWRLRTDLAGGFPGHHLSLQHGAPSRADGHPPSQRPARGLGSGPGSEGLESTGSLSSGWTVRLEVPNICLGIMEGLFK